MRNIRNCFIGLIIMLISIPLIAQERAKALKMLEKRGEIYVKFNYPNIRDLKQLSKNLSIDKLNRSETSTEVYAYLNMQEFTQFSEKAIDFEMLTPPSLLMEATMCPDLSSVENWNCYPTYTQYLDLMQAFETNYPDLCKLVEIGQSVDGRKLLVLKISDNVSTKEEEPEFLYTSTMHGDEVTGYVLMLRLIDYLLTNYTIDSRVADLIDNTEIWINPLSNPDGTYYASNNSLLGARRANSNGVDLNRNFPDPIDGEHPDGHVWQPENIAMMNFMKSHNFVLSANFHGGVEVVNYPWDSWESIDKIHADDVWYQEISREYADTVHANSINYMIYKDNGITNGGDWYTVSGGRQDYMNYYLHSREVTIEISTIKVVDAVTLPIYWDYNYRSFLNYINRVHTGIYGKVTDQDGNPLAAKITLAYHDADSSEVYADASNGMYYRMIGDGNYHLLATFAGYSQEEFDVNVPSLLNVEQNIVLQKYPQGVYDLENSYARITRLQNPIENKLEFQIELEQNVKFNLDIIDVSGRQLKHLKINGLRGDNKINLEMNDLNSGIYFCKIQSELFSMQFKLVKLDH